MDFTLSEEQELLRDTARSLLRDECPISVVRAHMRDPAVADPLWARLREWLGVADGPLVDLCLFLEETGAVLAPGPFFATTALYWPVARATGIDPGEGAGTVVFGGDDPPTPYVVEAARAQRVAVIGPGPAVGVHNAVHTREVRTVDPSRRLFALTDAPPDAATPVAADALAEAYLRMTVALAAELMGTTRWLVDAAVAYAKERHQFDRAIGSFQAVQHKLADMALAREQAWSAVYYAAMCLDAEHGDRHRAAHVAAIMASEAATRAAKDAIQVHGGIGYTWEHDLHLYIRRAYGSEHLLGTRSRHRDRLASLVLA